MRYVASLILAMLALAGAGPPEAAIPYFAIVRDIHISQASRQNFFIVDVALWNHSRPDLGDVRLYDDRLPVQYFIAEQSAGISSEEVEARILNLGRVAGHTEFDLDANGIAEYDRIVFGLTLKILSRPPPYREERRLGKLQPHFLLSRFTTSAVRSWGQISFCVCPPPVFVTFM